MTDCAPPQNSSTAFGQSFRGKGRGKLSMTVIIAVDSSVIGSYRESSVQTTWELDRKLIYKNAPV